MPLNSLMPAAATPCTLPEVVSTMGKIWGLSSAPGPAAGPGARVVAPAFKDKTGPAPTAAAASDNRIRKPRRSVYPTLRSISMSGSFAVILLLLFSELVLGLMRLVWLNQLARKD